MLFKSNYIRIAWQSDGAEATGGAVSRAEAQVENQAGGWGLLHHFR